MTAESKQRQWEVELPRKGTPLSLQMHLGDEFFAAAEHADMQGGSVDATVELRPAADRWTLHLECRGQVQTSCDRCLGEMTVDIADSYDAPLLPSEGGLEPQDADSDAAYYDPATGIADLLRPLADTIALSLGICHTHPDGECDPEIEAALDNHDPEANTPLADALSHLLNNNSTEEKE